MNIYSEIVLFAVVLAANLVLSGGILAGGLTLAFRFVENISPRLRYRLAVAVFALAILLPAAVTLKIPFSREFPTESTNTQNYDQKSINPIASNNFLFRENEVIALLKTSESITFDLLGKFISIAAGSLFGKVFVGLWISGIAWLLFREALGIRRLQRARKFWEPAAEAERAALLCPTNIPLYFDERQSPGTAGLICPAIVLPRRFSDGLTTAAKVLIVRHELAHAQRRDPLLSFILRLFRALFWISPALWLLERLIDAEREAAADRAAIGFSPREPEFETLALNYADALLTVARDLNFSGQQHRESPVIGIGTGSELEIRISRLLSVSRTNRLHIASACAAGTLCVVMIMIFPGVGFSEQSIILQSEFTAATAERKNSSPDERRIEPPTANPQDETAQSSARAGERRTPSQVRAVKTKVSEEAAEFLTTSVDIMSGKTAKASESDENQRVRPLQSFENTPQTGQTIYGPARKSEPGIISPLAASGSELNNGYEPARQKREGEYQARLISNQMPATAPR